MTRPYGKKNTHNTGFLKQASIAFVSLVVGYLAASVCDMNTLGGWLGKQVLAQQEVKPGSKSADNAAELPKPKLEFYTLLTNERVPDGSSQVAAIPAPPVPTATSTTAAPSPLVTVATVSPSVVPQSVNKMPTTQVAAIEKPVIEVANNKNAFMVQIAAFKNKQDAERMRAVLIMKGFDVSVASVIQGTGSWHRVIMGPFSSRTAAVQAQLSVAKSERIMGMIRKMDV